MRVELLIARASAAGTQNVGDEVDVSDAEAKRLIKAGQARPVRRARRAETAVPRSRAETAAK